MIGQQKCKRARRTVEIKPTRPRISLSRFVFVSLTAYLPIILLLHVASSFYTGQVTAAPHKYVEDNCCTDDDLKLAQQSKAAHVLLILKCKIKPQYESFKNTFHQGVEPSSIGNNGRIAEEFAKLSQVIDAFAQDGLKVISQSDQCANETFDLLAKLRTQVENDDLLGLAYDIISMESHRNCMVQVLKSMPKVPSLIEEVVSIYIDGPESNVMDLNLMPRGPDANDGTDFDVSEAIAKYGQLEQVAAIGLTLSDDFSKNAEDFRTQCDKFRTKIIEVWKPIDRMNEDLAIKALSDCVRKHLRTTKYSNICTKLSRWKPDVQLV